MDLTAHSTWPILLLGIASTTQTHLAYNAGLGALPLLRAGHPYFVANGVLVIVGLVLPILPGAVRWVRRRLGPAPAPAPRIIRRAEAEEIPGLSSLGAGEVDWAAWLKDPAAAVLCLCAGADLIGAAAGRVEADDVGRVTILYVAPAWRRRYWGSRLVEALSGELWERGARSLEVAVPSEAWALARFWDVQGWQPSATTYRLAAERSQLHRP